MLYKKLIIVILISIAIGVLVFYFTGNTPKTVSNIVTQAQNVAKTSPTPTPKPTWPPLSSESNLSEEINNLESPDFASDIKLLKDETATF